MTQSRRNSNLLTKGYPVVVVVVVVLDEVASHYCGIGSILDGGI